MFAIQEFDKKSEVLEIGKRGKEISGCLILVKLNHSYTLSVIIGKLTSLSSLSINLHREIASGKKQNLKIKSSEETLPETTRDIIVLLLDMIEEQKRGSV